MNYLNETIRSEDLQTRVLVSRVESKYQNYDLSFVRYWKESGLVDDAFIRSYHDYNSLMPKRGANPQGGIRCLVHWARFNIDSDGKAILCFNELFRAERREDLLLGDVNFQQIQEIWHAENIDPGQKSAGTWRLFPGTFYSPDSMSKLFFIANPSVKECRPVRAR